MVTIDPMPDVELACPPLSRQQISQVLHGIASPPPAIAPHLAIDALTVTASSLRTWCNPADIEVPAMQWSTTKAPAPQVTI